jgi:CRP-like cAMP-binding protein
MEHNFEANFFTLLEFLDPASRLEVESACIRRSAQPNEIIYSQGDPSNAIYIVETGVVEALTQSEDGQQSRSVGFMRKGDFFGDLGILTNHHRLATIRACEPAELLQIEKLAYVHLLEKIPKFATYFARNLARRLHDTSTHAYLNVFAVDLSGNLRHFDLLTIFQAITNMARTGELQINSAGNELVGSFFFRDGQVEFARFAHLDGLEAIWEGFVQAGTDGNFTFRAMEKPSVPFDEAHKIEVAGTDLLLHGVTHRDAYHALPEALRSMEGRLSRVTEVLDWPVPESAPFANQLWEMIAKRPQPLASLWRRNNYSSLAFLETVYQLIATGQAQILLEPAPEGQTETQPLPQKPFGK